MKTSIACPDIKSMTYENHSNVVTEAMAWAQAQREVIYETSTAEAKKFASIESLNAYYDGVKEQMEEVQRTAQAFLARARELVQENHALQVAALKRQLH